MSSEATYQPVMAIRPVTRGEACRQFWEAWREPIAGMLIIAGLSWTYLLPSLFAPVRWWMIIGLTVIGGLMRQRRAPYSRTAMLPLWIFLLIVLLFALYSYTFQPLSDYGREKLTDFTVYACAAYIAGSRQAPLTEGLLRGMRWGLFGTLVLCLLVVYVDRDLFLQQQQYGIGELRDSISMTMLPLATAMGVLCLLPRKITPLTLLTGGLVLVLGSALLIFERGRFHALVLAALAVCVVLGPPWKHIFWRVMICGALLLLALVTYLTVLPMMGDSYLYLTWLNADTIAGRAPAWAMALQGFLAHPMGQGIGSFASVGGEFSYPHNVILEVAFELGFFGLCSMLWLYLATFFRVIRLWCSPPHRMLAVLLLLPFLHILKAGDISTLAFHWIFLYMLIVATPLAANWRLRSGMGAA
jgi:O-antigen ligase